MSELSTFSLCKIIDPLNTQVLFAFSQFYSFHHFHLYAFVLIHVPAVVRLCLFLYYVSLKPVKCNFPLREDKYWLNLLLIHFCWKVCLHCIKAWTEPCTPLKSSVCGCVFSDSTAALKESVWMAVCALNLHWAHLWADKNRFKYCRPESCSDCPPNISIEKSFWCSWRTNNNYNRVLLISLRVLLLRSPELVCLELFGRRGGIPLVYSFT